MRTCTVVNMRTDISEQACGHMQEERGEERAESKEDRGERREERGKEDRYMGVLP